jgi:probable phosphoglycerate mutase
MSAFPLVYLVRHGETAWSLTRQHTGLKDLPLTDRGRQAATEMKDRLSRLAVDHVFTSPLQRASLTCELAGFGDRAEVDADLVEWDYGQFEGLTKAEILQKQPGWHLFRDGCPGGETIAEISARADRVVSRLRQMAGQTLLFSSGHFLRVLTARWLGLGADAGRFWTLDTTSLSTLGYEHSMEEPIIRLWNDSRTED